MNKNHQFFAQTLESIHDRKNAIYIGSGVEIALHLASRPMILALRKKYRQNKYALLITQKGVKFLFSFPGHATPKESTFY